MKKIVVASFQKMEGAEAAYLKFMRAGVDARDFALYQTDAAGNFSAINLQPGKFKLINGLGIVLAATLVTALLALGALVLDYAGYLLSFCAIVFLIATRGNSNDDAPVKNFAKISPNSFLVRVREQVSRDAQIIKILEDTGAVEIRST